jgi:hypothetical protein
MTGRPTRTICRTLRIGRATVYRPRRPRGRRYAKASDRVVHAPRRAVVTKQATYGYRRATAMVTRRYGAGYNRKRIQRVMASVDTS